MKILLSILLLFTLVGCNEVKEITERNIPDQCLRRELFNECMKALPGGPIATHYNDWDDVVSECRAYAWSVSVRLQSVVKKECQ
jgi:hypothetical protein